MNMKKVCKVSMATGCLLTTLAAPLSVQAMPLVLTADETADLQFMREEEKLALDIYTALYAKWGVQAFNNIAQAEQRHMDRLKMLIDHYGIHDPLALESKVGVFQNKELQALYDQLLKQGQQSLVEALKVGALIEETDIQDLQEAAQRSDQAMIDRVYGNLERGSRNHLRAFMRQIKRNGGVYKAQVLPQAEFDQIVNSSHERGNGRGGQGRRSAMTE